MPEVEWGSRGAEKVFRDNEQIAKSTRKTGDAAKDAGRDMQEMGRIAARIAKDNETAYEKYARQLVNAKKALDQEKISTEQFNRETARTTVEYLKATDGASKYTRVLASLNEGQRKISQEMPRIRTGTNDAFGGASLGHLIKFGAKALSIVGGLAGIVSTMKQAQAEVAAAGQTLITAGHESGELAVEAGGDPKKLRRMRAAAQQTMMEGGFGKSELGRAYQLQAALESGGITGDRGFFSRLQSMEDATAAANSVGKVRSVFGAGEAGSRRTDSLEGRSRRPWSYRRSRNDVMGAVATAGKAAQGLGLSDEEVFAVVEQIGNRTGDVTDAGSRAKKLFQSLKKRGFEGQSLTDSLKQIGGRGLSQRALGKLLGASGAETFNMLRDTDALGRRRQGVETAQQSLTVEREIAAHLAQPEVAAGREVNALEAEAQLSLEGKGLRSRRLQAQRTRAVSETRAELPGVMAEPLLWGTDKVRAYTPDALEEGFLQATGQMTSGPAEGMADLARKLDQNNEYMRRQTQIMERENHAAPVPSGPRE